MPFTIRKRGDKFVVVKKAGDSRVFGSHNSRTKAVKQIAAIESSERRRKGK